jgi:hypothetical protein
MIDEDNNKADTNVKAKKTWNKIRSIPTLQKDEDNLKAMTFKDKVYYLTIRGWKIEIEKRGGKEYIYAVKYFERKKRRIYLGKSEDGPDIRKTRSTTHNINVNFEDLIALNFKDRIYYLAIRGWKIEIETKSGEESIIAIKYIDRKKDKISLGKKIDRPELEKID